MPKSGEELCSIKVFREAWRVLNEAADLEEARKRFRELTLKLILEET